MTLRIKDRCFAHQLASGRSEQDRQADSNKLAERTWHMLVCFANTQKGLRLLGAIA